MFSESLRFLDCVWNGCNGHQNLNRALALCDKTWMNQTN